jgi:hypothetical protein
MLLVSVHNVLAIVLGVGQSNARASPPDGRQTVEAKSKGLLEDFGHLILESKGKVNGYWDN